MWVSRAEREEATGAGQSLLLVEAKSAVRPGDRILQSLGLQLSQAARPSRMVFAGRPARINTLPSLVLVGRVTVQCGNIQVPLSVRKAPRGTSARSLWHLDASDSTELSHSIITLLAAVCSGIPLHSILNHSLCFSSSYSSRSGMPLCYYIHLTARPTLRSNSKFAGSNSEPLPPWGLPNGILSPAPRPPCLAPAKDRSRPVARVICA